MTQEKAVEKARREIARYESAAQIRKENAVLYMFLRRRGLCHMMPKDESQGCFSKLLWTDEELLELASRYSSPEEIEAAENGRRLRRTLRSRGILPERLAYQKQQKQRPDEKKEKKEPKPKRQPSPEDILRDWIPEEFRPGSRKGAYACFRARQTDSGIECGRCRREFAAEAMSVSCKDLCGQCYSDRLAHEKDGKTELNILGNVLDQYCHIVISLPDGPMYVGIEVSEQEERRLRRWGYGFVLKRGE